MPSFPPSSSDSPPPSATPSGPEVGEAAGRQKGTGLAPSAGVGERSWRLNLWLFLATVVSVVVTPAYWALQATERPPLRTAVGEGLQFAAALLTILLAHEFGHYITARIHKVDASLPFFIPLPIFSPFGTMGAVIRMRGVIPTRKALLDIGASGPLAGLVFAIPMYFWGITQSKLVPLSGENGVQLGSSILS